MPGCHTHTETGDWATEGGLGALHTFLDYPPPMLKFLSYLPQLNKVSPSRHSSLGLGDINPPEPQIPNHILNVKFDSKPGLFSSSFLFFCCKTAVLGVCHIVPCILHTQCYALCALKPLGAQIQPCILMFTALASLWIKVGKLQWHCSGCWVDALAVWVLMPASNHPLCMNVRQKWVQNPFSCCLIKELRYHT